MAPGGTDRDTDTPTPKSVKFGQVFHSLPPEIGETVYTMRGTLLEEWCAAKVVGVIDTPREKKYQVETVEDDGDEPEIKEVTTSQMASSSPPIHKLSIGTRIIARYKDLLEINPETNNLYYIGIIAEPLLPHNHFRYLVFFDDGCAQYVDKDDILLVYKQAQEVWTEVHPSAKHFVKEYIEDLLGRPKVKLAPNRNIAVELYGTWYSGVVEEVDGSLAKVRFLTDGTHTWEWIYRGSPRLHPIFKLHNMLGAGRKRKGEIIPGAPLAKRTGKLSY